MKICIAQTRPVKGDITSNITGHKRLIDLAVRKKSDVIIFPELSITGYEPTLANELAITKNDDLLEEFQEISNQNDIVIGVGMPMKTITGFYISMFIFQPNKDRSIYSKKYLHDDEKPYFESGENFPVLRVKDINIGIAICYELSIPEHSELAFENGANIYLASVAKTKSGVENAWNSLSGIAKRYHVPVLMSNCLGICDGVECIGKSAIWNTDGQLLEALDDQNEGILVYDTDEKKVEKVIAD